MTTNLFSTYRQGENRVTHTFLAVLQRISLPHTDRILQALLQDTAFSLVTFENQPKGFQSIPDARIGTGPTVWIETKTEANKVDHEQISRHLEVLGDSERLLLLTPDIAPPDGLGEQVIWANFDTLAVVIDEILRSDEYAPTETEAFLLRELTSMLREDGLIDAVQGQVLVVAAQQAWPMYRGLSVYRCQPNRRFRPCEYMAFYAEGRIQRPVARIKSTIESIDLSRSEVADYLDDKQKKYTEKLLSEVKRRGKEAEFYGQCKLMYLSGESDSDTIILKKPVENDLTNERGRRYAFVQGQRYVPLESLQLANTTSDL